MKKETRQDLQKVIGTPKVIFIVGGDGSGKATQCLKLVEEFGFKLINAEKLLMAEVAKVSANKYILVDLTAYFVFREPKKVYSSKRLWILEISLSQRLLLSL